MANYKPWLRPEVSSLKPYSPGKPIEEVKRELGLEDVIKLASNENPLGPSPVAIEAMRKAAPDVWMYPENESPELVQALAEFYGLTPANIVCGAGSDELLHMLCLAFLAPGSEAISGEPPFMQYVFGPQLMGAKPVLTPMPRLNQDVDLMLAAVTDKTRLVFIANPHNPCGTMVKKQDMDRLLDNLPDHVLVVLDEAYYEYVDSSDYPDGVEYLKQGRNVVVTRTFSKAYGLAGQRIGYAMADPELIGYLWQVKEPFSVTRQSQVAALAALGDQDHVAKGRKLNREGVELFCNCFDELGLFYGESYANLVLVDTKRDCKLVYNELLKRGVIVRSGEPFGLSTYIRVSTGLPEQNQRFVDTFREVFALVPPLED